MLNSIYYQIVSRSEEGYFTTRQVYEQPPSSSDCSYCLLSTRGDKDSNADLSKSNNFLQAFHHRDVYEILKKRMASRHLNQS